MKLNYSEGTWFAVTLTGGGFGVGVVARATKKGRVILVYLFGPKREAVPSLSEVAGLDPSAAVAVIRIGDLHLIDGKWPILGRSPEWQRENWPMPMFTRKPPFLNHAYNIRYSDVDPSCEISETKVPLGISSSMKTVRMARARSRLCCQSSSGAMPRGRPIPSRRARSRPSPVASRKGFATPSTFQNERRQRRSRRGCEAKGSRSRHGGEPTRPTGWCSLAIRLSKRTRFDRLEEQFTKYAEASGGEYDGYER